MDIWKTIEIGNFNNWNIINSLERKEFIISNSIKNAIKNGFIQEFVEECYIGINRVEMIEIGYMLKKYPDHREILDLVSNPIPQEFGLLVINQIQPSQFNYGFTIIEHKPFWLGDGLYNLAVDKLKDIKGRTKLFLEIIAASYMCLWHDDLILLV